MRKAYKLRFPILLVVSLSLFIATFAFTAKTNTSTCINTTECKQRIEKETLKEGTELLWESLSRQFVVSVIPE